MSKKQKQSKKAHEFADELAKVKEQRKRVTSFNELYTAALDTPFQVQDIDRQIDEKLIQFGYYILHVQNEFLQIALGLHKVSESQFIQLKGNHAGVNKLFNEFSSSLKKQIATLMLDYFIANHLDTLSDWLKFAKAELLNEVRLPIFQKDSGFIKYLLSKMKVNYDFSDKKVISTETGEKLKTFLSPVWPVKDTPGMPILKRVKITEMRKGMTPFAFNPPLNKGVTEHLEKAFATWYLYGLSEAITKACNVIERKEKVDFKAQSSTLLTAFMLAPKDILAWKNRLMFSTDGLQYFTIHLPMDKTPMNYGLYDSLISLFDSIRSRIHGTANVTEDQAFSSFIASSLFVKPFAPLVSHSVGTSHRVNLLHRGDGVLKDLINLGYIDFDNFKNYTTAAHIELLIDDEITK